MLNFFNDLTKQESICTLLFLMSYLLSPLNDFNFIFSLNFHHKMFKQYACLLLLKFNNIFLNFQ